MLFVEHLVLLKVKRPPTEEELKRIQSLTAIKGVAFVSAGPNYTKRGQGYNFGIVVRLTSKEAEAAYQTDPLHVDVRDSVIKPLLDTSQPAPVIAMDYEHNQRPKWALFALGFVAGVLATGLASRIRARP